MPHGTHCLVPIVEHEAVLSTPHNMRTSELISTPCGVAALAEHGKLYLESFYLRPEPFYLLSELFTSLTAMVA
jgi:hypothetical protein